MKKITTKQKLDRSKKSADDLRQKPKKVTGSFKQRLKTKVVKAVNDFAEKQNKPKPKKAKPPKKMVTIRSILDHEVSIHTARAFIVWEAVMTGLMTMLVPAALGAVLLYIADL